MKRFAALVGLVAILAGCTVERTAEVQTAASVSAHLREAAVEPARSLRISRAQLEEVQGTGRSLPWLLVFDSSGALIHEEEGYTLGLAARLERSLTGREPVSPPRSLAAEAASYETLDGEPVLLDPAVADFVFVDHWAVWCIPCKPQMRSLQRFIADHPDWEIDLVLVNWDEIARAGGP